ncbi:MAG: AgrD family cyclic lactone autoinducer peptide [Thermacetogeniaceae bacterium]
MKRLISRLLPALFSALTVIAVAGVVKPNCAGFWFYQPEAPAALKK